MKILVVGDLCDDVTVLGRVERISPEAPIPIFKYERREASQGMAGNVKYTLELLGNEVDLIAPMSIPTKTRFIDTSSGYMLMRMDENDHSTRIHVGNLPNLDQYDGVVICDYNKGALENRDIRYIAENSKLSFLDTKKTLGSWTEDVTFIKINELEYELNKQNGGRENLEQLIVTCGKNGARYKGKYYSVPQIELRNPCGAGDVFLAGLAHRYLETKDPVDAIKYANTLSTKKCSQRGIRLQL